MKENNDAKVVLSSRVLFLVKCKNIQYSFVSVIRVMGFLFNMLVDSKHKLPFPLICQDAGLYNWELRHEKSRYVVVTSLDISLSPSAFMVGIPSFAQMPRLGMPLL